MTAGAPAATSSANAASQSPTLPSELEGRCGRAGSAPSELLSVVQGRVALSVGRALGRANGHERNAASPEVRRETAAEGAAEVGIGVQQIHLGSHAPRLALDPHGLPAEL